MSTPENGKFIVSSSTHIGGKGGLKRMKKMNRMNRANRAKKMKMKMNTPTCYKRKDVSSSTGERIYASRPCPFCGHKTLRPTPKSTKGVDYKCTRCNHKVELKQGEAVLLNKKTVSDVLEGLYTLPADTYVAHHQVNTSEEILDQEYRWPPEAVTDAIRCLPVNESDWPLTTEEKPRVVLGIEQLGAPVVVGTKKTQDKLATKHGFRFKVHDYGTRGNSIWRLNQKDLREVITKKRYERLAAKRQEDAMIQAIYLANSCTNHTHCDVGCPDCDFPEAWKQIRTILRKAQIRSAKIAQTKRAKLRMDGLTYDVMEALGMMSV
jgi:hypothetical protein